MPLTAAPGSRAAERMRAALLDASGTPPAPLVGVWERLSSTNDVARALALDAGETRSAGSVVVAGSQTAGRGRFGRTWISPPGGLYLSVLVEPAAPPAGQADGLSLLPLAAGVAVARAVRSAAGIVPELRWPNDLDWNGRKVAGVLAEAGFHRRRPRLAVIGFGLNLEPLALPGGAGFGEGPPGRPPGSLPAGTDRTELARVLLASLRETLGTLEEDPAALRDSWERFSPTARGCRCEIQLAGARWESGRTRGLDPGGGLRVGLEDGRLRAVTASEAIRIRHSSPDTARLGVAGG